MGTTAFRDVELVTTGTHGASTGATTIDEDDFAAIVAAYQDHVVDRPMVKLGHDDDGAMNDALKDGEPAYGWIENVAVGDGSQARPNRQSLYGDLVGIPAKLAEIIPAAFRRRSVEIAWGVTTSTGKKYAAVLAAVALLGAKKPAVKGLGDLIALYSDHEQIAAAEALTGIEISENDDDTGTVRPQQSAAGDGGDVDNNDTKTQEPKMPKLTKTAILEAVKDLDDDAELTDEQLKALGLAAPATPAAPAEPVAPNATGEVVEVEEQTAASAAPETVTITKSMFSELQEGAQLAQETAKEIAKTRRDGIVKTAFSEGRIAKTEVDEWRKALDRDEAGTTSLLSALAPRFSTTEIGFDDAPKAEFSDAESKQVEAFLDDFKKNFG